MPHHHHPDPPPIEIIIIGDNDDEVIRLIKRGFRHVFKELDRIQEDLNLLQTDVDEIQEELEPKPLTKSVANIFIGVGKMADNVLVFNVGQTSIDTLTPRLADGVTPSGGVVSNDTVNFSDPSATATVNADNTVTFVGVADSAGIAVSGSTVCTVTDTDGAVSQWTISFTVQTISVTPPPPDQLTQSVANVFSTPTP
jgi:hypothetical protein